MEQELLKQKRLRDIKSQEEYINHIPIEDLMTWPSFRLNVFDQLDDLKYVAISDEAKMVVPYYIGELMGASV